MEQSRITKLMEVTEILNTPVKLLDKIKVSESYYEQLKSEHQQIINNEPIRMMGVPIEIDNSIIGEYEFIYKTLT